MTNHSKNYEWGYKAGAWTLTQTGTVDRSGAKNYTGAGEATFTLNGTTVTLDASFADLAAYKTGLAAAITLAGMTAGTAGAVTEQFTITDDGSNHIILTSTAPFTLADGVNTPIVTDMGLAAQAIEIVAMDCEIEDSELPGAQFIRERFYGAAGGLMKPVKSKEHYDGKFPTFLQSDTFVTAIVADQADVGGTPTLYSLIWTDGTKVYVIDNAAYIKEYELDIPSDGYPKQVTTFGFRSITAYKYTTSIMDIPDRDTTTAPKDSGDVSMTIGGSSITELTSCNVLINNNVNDDKNAVGWDRHSNTNNKKDITIKATFKDSNLAIYDAEVDGVVADRTISIVNGLGTLAGTKFGVEECKVNTISVDPELYEYDMTLTNNSGDTLGWS